MRPTPPSLISLTLIILLSMAPIPTNPLVRTLEVSPRVPANHDTFLYLCSLDINEQNVGVLAYRNVSIIVLSIVHLLFISSASYLYKLPHKENSFHCVWVHPYICIGSLSLSLYIETFLCGTSFPVSKTLFGQNMVAWCLALHKINGREPWQSRWSRTTNFLDTYQRMHLPIRFQFRR